MNKINQKGIGPGMTWYVAVVAIFFITIVFLVWAFILAGQKKIGNDNELGFDDKGTSKLSLQRDLHVFLNTQVEFEGEEISMAELIDNSHLRFGDDNNLFNVVAKEFLLEYYPQRSGSLSNHVWIKVFENGEDLVSFSKKDKTGRSFRFGEPGCEPRKWRDSFAEQVINDKRIVLCVDKEYFND